MDASHNAGKYALHRQLLSDSDVLRRTFADYELAWFRIALATFSNATAERFSGFLEEAAAGSPTNAIQVLRVWGIRR